MKDSKRVDYTPTGKPTKHGTTRTYNRGCRCDECKTAISEWSRGARKRRSIKGLPDDDGRHGTVNGYRNYGCRCKPCTDVATLQSAKHQKPYFLKKERCQELFSQGREIKHGTQYSYGYYGCRCDECREYMRVKNKDYQDRKRAEKNVRQQDSSNRSR